MHSGDQSEPFRQVLPNRAATLLITTRNRKEDLRRALESALQQSAPLEVLVIDDASTDQTSEMVRREYPSVRLYRDETPQGLIVQRNRGAKLASGSIIFSIDDDAIFSSSTIVETTLQAFNHPRVGAVAIPFIDVNRSRVLNQKAPKDEGVYATYSYIGTAHALRRDLFETLGGYRESLFHQGEEEDYCIRMLEAGFITRCGVSDPIHHFESPRRSLTRMDYYGSRNKILYAWQNVPFPYLAAHLPVTTVGTLLHCLQPARFWTRSRGVLAGYSWMVSNRQTRRAVSGKTYRLSRNLKCRGAVELAEIEPMLPGPCPDSRVGQFVSVH